MMDFFNYKGKKIAFHKKGEGTGMIFLHGFCEDQTMWKAVESQASEWGITFISLDLPGFGHSDPIEHCSIEEMADIVEAFCNAYELNHISMMGHSMGGYVALAFAEKYAYRLIGFGLIHSHPYADSPEKKEARQKSIDFIEKNGSETYVRQLIPKLFPADFAEAHPEIIQPLVEKAMKYDPLGIINALEAMKNRPDRTDVLRSLDADIPVLFIIGEKDDLEPQELLIGQTCMPDVASIHILEDVGHMGLFEAPQKISQLIGAFTAFTWVNDRR